MLIFSSTAANRIPQRAGAADSRYGTLPRVFGPGKKAGTRTPLSVEGMMKVTIGSIEHGPTATIPLVHRT